MVCCILWYIKGTINFGLDYISHTALNLCAFFCSNWAGYLSTRHSTTGYCTFLGNNPISWCVKKHNIVSHSSTEAKYHTMSHTASKITWLTFILKKLGVPQTCPPMLFCDNLSTLHMIVNPVFYACSKHIELDYHFACEQVALSLLVTQHISITHQVADIFTKLMSKVTLALFHLKLHLQHQPILQEDINTHQVA